jgi:hypothetical protein
MSDSKKQLETTARQARYVADQEARGEQLGLVFADAFIRGMRDIGYKNPAWALSEVVDNSVQAQAKTVEVVLGDLVSRPGGSQPQQLAVVDDGVGMLPQMLSYAVRWGGTEREGDRQGFGRYGYGLPSAAVSIACRYSVYSKVEDGDWHRVTVDIHELSKIANDPDAVVSYLTPVRAAPPDWVADVASKIQNLKGLTSGTVVVLEDLDRLRKNRGWRTEKALKHNFREHLGLVYRHWLGDLSMFVAGGAVEPLDPLFLTPSSRLFDETDVRALRVDTGAIKVESEQGRSGAVRVRASLLPWGFQFRRGQTGLPSSRVRNSRDKILRKYSGIHVCRDGREIDVVSPRWTKFQNYDRFLRIEVDFSPELDEFFGITTSKQQITIDDEMWDRLENQLKLRDLVADMRRQFRDSKSRWEAQHGIEVETDQARESETAMLDSLSQVRRLRESDRKTREADELFDREVKRIVNQERRDDHEVRKQLESEVAARPFKVELRAIDEGPFYKPERLGRQRRLLINTAHPFYSAVYDKHPDARAALEVLLFVLADGELDAEGDREAFYKGARLQWSERLLHALDELTPASSLSDAASHAAELIEMEAAPEPEDEA